MATSQSSHTCKSKRFTLRPMDDQKTIGRLQNDYLKCSLCQQLLRNPKCLTCQHRFCLDCLFTYVQNRRTLPGQIFSCPYECSDRTELPQNGVHGLATDEFLVEIQTTLTRRHNDSAKRPVLHINTASPHEPTVLPYGGEDDDDNYEMPIIPPPVKAKPKIKDNKILKEIESMKGTLQKEILRLTEEIGLADIKTNKCEENLAKLNPLMGDIIDAIASQEKIQIRNISKRAEALRQKAIDIVTHESKILSETSKKTQKTKGRLIWYKDYAEKSLQSSHQNMKDAVITFEQLGEQLQLQEPISVLNLAVHRTAQADAKPFNLLVQKKPLLMDIPSKCLRRETTTNQIRPTTLRKIPESMWYLAESDEEDPDAHTDRFLGQIIQQQTIKKIRSSSDSGYGDPDVSGDHSTYSDKPPALPPTRRTRSLNSPHGQAEVRTLPRSGTTRPR